MSAWNVSQWCSPWIPEHAYIDVDDVDDKVWSAQWSTPDGIWKLTYIDCALSISGKYDGWVDVKLRYPQREQVEAILGILLPVQPGLMQPGGPIVQERTPATEHAAAGPEAVVHEEKRAWGGMSVDSGAECVCGVAFDGFDSIAEARSYLRKHIASAAEHEATPLEQAAQQQGGAA